MLAAVWPCAARSSKDSRVAKITPELGALVKVAPSKPTKATALSTPGVELAGRTGVTWLHVPYSGGAPAVTSVVAGQTDLMFATFGSARALLADGKIRPLAISLLQRSELLPDVPTFEEPGIPGFAPGGWYSLAAPPGMSEGQTTALSNAAEATITSETFRDFMRQNALTPLPRGPAQALSLVKADLVRQGALMQRAGIRPE